MDQLTLYNQILQLSPPWFTTKVDLIADQELVLVTVSYSEGTRFLCPKCSEVCDQYDTRKRRWRHLDTCQYKTFIEAEVPRVICPNHGCLTLQVPWALEQARYTKVFENTVLKWIQEASILALSRRFRLSWTAINGILKRGVQRGLERPRRYKCVHLSVDETCIGANRDFITILSNHEGQVLAVEDGRSSESLLRCFKRIPIHFLNKVKTISMDMSPAYQKAVRIRFKRRADKLIAFDHFHVTKKLTETLHQVRKAEVRSMPNIDQLYLHKTRYHWLRNGQKLTLKKLEQLESQKTYLHDTATTWFFKEKAREIWQGHRQLGARKAWKQWISLAGDTDIVPLIAVASMIEEKLKGILTAMKYGVSNARAEAINNKIKAMARRAYGFRNRERYKAAIMFYLGRLAMDA